MSLKLKLKFHELARRTLCVAAFFSASAIWAQEQAPAPVTGDDAAVLRVDSYGHTVADLDKTLAFYHDLLGLEVSAVPAKPKANAVLGKLTNLNGATFRTAHVKIPNAAFELALLEVTGVPRTPGSGRHTDPGVVVLNLSVRDIDLAFKVLKAAGVPTMNDGATPTRLSGDTRAVWIRDPDGYLVEIIQRDARSWFSVPPPPLAPVPGSRYVINGALGITVADLDRGLALYHDVFEFKLKEKQVVLRPDMAEMVGISQQALFRVALGNCAWIRCELYQFGNLPQTPLRLRIQDPGAPIMALYVKNLEQVKSQMVAKGAQVVSLNGAAVRDGETLRVLMQDRDGIYIELMQKPGVGATPVPPGTPPSPITP
jgi:catechol 2,3-dioxygenase-like lactoylglutathione lyase family enzyme